MKRKHKLYLKLNLMSIVFLIVSLISVTLAWFAYAGLADVKTDLDVKAWNIELKKDGETVSNDIVVSLDDIYPGMDMVSEVVNINNLGDADAQISYEIKSARVLGATEDNFVVDGETITTDYVEDLLSHEYPFHINMTLGKQYALSKTGTSYFIVNVSWPLDSDDNELDSLWGEAAYSYEQYQSSMKTGDANYQIKPSIQIVISVKAEQYIATDTSSDPNYNMGDELLFDVVSNSRCTELSSTCLKTYVIDRNNTLGDTSVTLLPALTSSFTSGAYTSYNTILNTYTSSWTVNKRALVVDDILKIVSSDITNTILKRDGISDLVIGSLNYNNRMETEINRAINYGGYFRFLNQGFPYIVSSDCHWTSTQYDASSAFAVKANGEPESIIYNEEKTTTCKVVPVIIANKTDL